MTIRRISSDTNLENSEPCLKKLRQDPIEEELAQKAGEIEQIAQTIFFSPQCQQTSNIYLQKIEKTYVAEASIDFSTLYRDLKLSSPLSTLEDVVLLQQKAVYDHMKREDLSIEELQKFSIPQWIFAIQKNRQEVPLYLNLARRLEKGGSVELEKEKSLTQADLYELALTLDPSHLPTYHLFAQFLILKKDFAFLEKAKQLYAKAITIKPSCPKAYIGMIDLLDTKEIYQIEGQIALPKEELAYKIMQEHPQFSDAHRCLADCMRQNPDWVKGKPELDIKKIYGSALTLDPKNVKAYIGLYRECSQDESVDVSGQSQSTFDTKVTAIILKAALVCRYDPELEAFLRSEKGIEDKHLRLFLHMLSNSEIEIPSAVKRWLYEILLSTIFYKNFSENYRIYFIKVLLKAIRQEFTDKGPEIFSHDKHKENTDIFSKEITNCLSSEGLTLVNAPEEIIWMIRNSCYRTDISYPYLVWKLTKNCIKEGEANPLSFQKVGSLWAHVICCYPHDPVSYTLLADCGYKDKSSPLHSNKNYESLYISLLLYTMSLDININFLEGLLGLFDVLQRLGKRIKTLSPEKSILKDYFLENEKKLLKRPVIESYSVKLSDQKSLSFQEIVQKIMDLLTRSSVKKLQFFLKDIVYFIHTDPAKDISYASLFSKLQENKCNPTDLVHLALDLLQEEFLIGITGISPDRMILLIEDRQDKDLAKRVNVLRGLIFNLAQNIKISNMKTDKKQHLIYQQELFAQYPVMSDPHSFLDQLTLVPIEAWSRAFKEFTCNSYFYCNLARYLLALGVAEDQNKKYNHLLNRSNLNQMVSDKEKRHLIWDLFFKSLHLNPADAKTYSYMAQSLVILYPEYRHLSPVFAQLLYTMCIEIQSDEAYHYLDLLAVNRDEKTYLLLSKEKLNTKQLFLRALIVNYLQHKQLSYVVVCKKDFSDKKVLIEPLTQEKSGQDESSVIKTFETRIKNKLNFFNKKFPKSKIYFTLNSSSHPYLAYNTETATFERSFYVLDYFSDQLHQILGKKTELGIQEIRRWLQAESLAGIRPLLALGIISQSLLSRQNKLKLYDALYEAIFEIIHEGSLDYFLVNLLSSHIRIGEINYRNIYYNLKKGGEFGYHFNDRLRDLFRPISHRLFGNLDSSVLCTIEGCLCQSQTIECVEHLEEIKKHIFKDVSRDDLYFYIEAYMLFAEHMQNHTCTPPYKEDFHHSYVSVKDVDYKILQLSLSHPEIWDLLDKKKKALFYVRLAHSLNNNEGIRTIKKGEKSQAIEGENNENHSVLLTTQIQPASDTPIQNADVITKTQLYFTAIILNPTLLEAYIGLQGVNAGSFEIVTKDFPLKDSLQALTACVQNALLSSPHWEGPITIQEEDLDENEEEADQLEELEKRREERIYQSVQYIIRSPVSKSYQFVSIADFYLKMIDCHPNVSCSYYLLANHLKETQKEKIQLLNQIWLSVQDLYRRSVQLDVQESKAYYQVAIHLKNKQGIALFDGKTVLGKLDLLAAAFLRSAHSHSHFYFVELIRHLKKQRESV